MEEKLEETDGLWALPWPLRAVARAAVHQRQALVIWWSTWRQHSAGSHHVSHSTSSNPTRAPLVLPQPLEDFTTRMCYEVTHSKTSQNNSSAYLLRKGGECMQL